MSVLHPVLGQRSVGGCSMVNTPASHRHSLCPQQSGAERCDGSRVYSLVLRFTGPLHAFVTSAALSGAYVFVPSLCTVAVRRPSLPDCQGCEPTRSSAQNAGCPWISQAAAHFNARDTPPNAREVHPEIGAVGCGNALCAWQEALKCPARVQVVIPMVSLPVIIH